jgi:hypothetical protein
MSLQLYDFGFNIPTDAIIDTIYIKIEGKSFGCTNCEAMINNISLIKDAYLDIPPDDVFPTNVFSTDDQIITYFHSSFL